MEEFFIDKLGDDEEDHVTNEAVKYWSDDEDGDSSQEKIDLDELPDDFDFNNKKQYTGVDSSLINDTYLITNYAEKQNNKKQPGSSNIEKLLKKSIIQPGFEKQFSIESMKRKRAIKKERKIEREKTKGKQWFDLPVQEITPEIENDLKVLKMRSVLDKQHFYKKNTITSIPKYFQVGTVIESPADFYSGRIVKSQRKKTLVEELLADAECKRYQKKKYKEIISDRYRTKRRPREPRPGEDMKRSNFRKQKKFT